MSDLISRQAVIEALLEKGQASKRYRIGDFWELNFEEIREAISTVPSAQTEKRTDKRTGTHACENTCEIERKSNDMISRQAAIHALAKEMPSLTTPDGSGEFDHDIQITDEAFVDCMRIINELPSAEPDLSEYSDNLWRNAYERGKRDALAERKTGRWIFGHTLGHSWMKCSECLVSQDGQTACFSYCPNCGAMMKEGEEHD